MSSFGEVLHDLREEKDISQKELASALNLATSSISAYERGKSLPPLDKLCDIADYFQVTTDYLLGRTTYNVNPAYLLEKVYGSKTVGDFVQALQSLSKIQKEAAMVMVGDMKFRADYKARAKSDETE